MQWHKRRGVGFMGMETFFRNTCNGTTGTEAPYFVFVHDVKELQDPDFTSFEYIQQDELNELAKVLEN